MNSIVLLIQLFDLILIVNALHFLGGTITWHPLNPSATGTPIGIIITQTYSWTYSRITCTNAMISANQLMPLGTYTTLAAINLICIANCANGSLGYIAPTVVSYCTDISAPIGTTVTQRSDTVYLEVGDDFSAAFQSGGWRPLTTNPAGPPWSISTHILVEARSDNGLYNNAPVATVMSPINIPVNISTVINVPVADADGDPTRCRWSINGTVDECGGVCPPGSLPPNTLIYPNCTIIIIGQNIGDWFAVTIMIEDFISVSSTIPLSSVPVQFLVQVVAPPACVIAPAIIGNPVEQSCTAVVVGETFTSQLVAVNYCGENVTIVDIATLSFAGMVKGNVTEFNASIYYTDISWTPTAAQVGYQVMCVMAFDSINSQSAQYCFKFFVSETGVCSCPGDVCLTTTTIDTKQQPGFLYWPLIGSIIGLALLGGTIWCCYLCSRYCWVFAGCTDTNKYNRTCEFYHIEQCIDPDCHYENRSNSATISSCLYPNSHLVNISDQNTNSSIETHKPSSGIIITMTSSTTENDHNVIRKLYKQTTDISKETTSDEKYKKINIDSDQSKLETNEKVKDLILIPSKHVKRQKESHIQSTLKQEASSSDNESPERSEKKSPEKTQRQKHRSYGADHGSRVIHVHSKETTSDEKYKKINIDSDQSKLETNEKAKDLILIPSKNVKRQKESHIQSTLEQEASSSDNELPERSEEKSPEKTQQQEHRSYGADHGSRVIHVHSKQPTTKHQSMVKNNIHLDHYDEFENAIRVCKDKSTVKHVSRPRQQIRINERSSSPIETIELSSIQSMAKPLINTTKSSKPLTTIPHIEHMHIEKKVKSKENSHSLDPVVQKRSKHKKHHKTLVSKIITVQNLPREYTIC